MNKESKPTNKDIIKTFLTKMAKFFKALFNQFGVDMGNWR